MAGLLVHLSDPDSRSVPVVIFVRLAPHFKAELSTDPWNSISQCVLGAQCGERPTEDCLCQAGKSPTWVFGEGLYPVPLKQDELGHECQPEALYPIYAAVLAPDGNGEEGQRSRKVSPSPREQAAAGIPGPKPPSCCLSRGRTFP